MDSDVIYKARSLGCQVGMDSDVMYKARSLDCQVGINSDVMDKARSLGCQVGMDRDVMDKARSLACQVGKGCDVIDKTGRKGQRLRCQRRGQEPPLLCRNVQQHPLEGQEPWLAGLERSTRKG
jgi:hypothetical protein